VATPLDLEFLKLAVQNAVFDRPTAEKCLEIIDLGQRRGQALSAAQVAVNLGFLDAKMADALSAMARSSQGGTKTADEGEGAFAIEGFELRTKLGRGPCGATYEAKRLADGETVAIKVLTRKFGKHARTLRSILDEVSAARGFEATGVVALRDVIEASGRNVLVFDRFRGKALPELLARGKLETLRATEIVMQIARALVAAHGRGLCHGDIRPAKILHSDGRVALADFGLAQAACLGSGFGQEGLPFGHPEYLAPEVVQERQARPTARTDIYALGILLYELCCGKVPYKGADHKATLRLHLVAPLPPPPDEVHISTALARVILSLSAKDPARRPKDARAALELLEGYKKARFSGLTSDAELPSAQAIEDAAKDISKDDWGRESVEPASHSDEWTADKIDSAERVGPAEFTPEAFEEESFEPGKQPAAKGYSKALEEAAADFLSGEVPSLLAKGPTSTKPQALPSQKGQGSAGDRFELRGNEEVLAASRRSFRFGVALLLLVLGGGVFAYLYGRAELHPPLPPPVVDPGPREPPVDPKKLDEEHARVVRAFVEETQREVRSLLSDQELAKALDKARANGNPLAAEPAFAPVQKQLLEEVRQAARARFALEKAAFEEKLRTNDPDGALKIAKKTRSWAIDDLVQKSQALIDRAEERLKELRPSDPQDSQSTPPDLLRGWVALPPRTFPGNGVELEHRGRGFEVDWDAKGKPPVARDRGVLVPAGTTIVHRLPFARPRVARFELSVLKSCPPSSIVILVGDREVGVNGALVPVRKGVPFAGDAARKDPPFLPGQVYALDVEVFAPLPDGRISFKGTLEGDKRPGERGVVDADELKGHFGLQTAVDIEVSFVRLSGVVDPEQLKAGPPK
jgi:serine/threonine protein kinase